mmetsp:Transcript_11128/g.24551  ORF Transcript_11128/g.24551 Transcript_11128/m.24551 type:complete len:121 (+) Transcript_11128:501-863(+)
MLCPTEQARGSLESLALLLGTQARVPEWKPSCKTLAKSPAWLASAGSLKCIPSSSLTDLAGAASPPPQSPRISLSTSLTCVADAASVASAIPDGICFAPQSAESQNRNAGREGGMQIGHC